jgi:hypothetical protein
VPEGDDDFFSIDAKPVPTWPIFEALNELGIDGILPLPNPPESILPFNEPGPAPNPGKDDADLELESNLNAAFDFETPPLLIPPPNSRDGDPPSLDCEAFIEFPPNLSAFLSCMPPPAPNPGEDELPKNVDGCFPFIASGPALEPNPPPNPGEDEPKPEL